MFEAIFKDEACRFLEATLNNEPEIISGIIANFVTGCTNWESHCEHERDRKRCLALISSGIGTRESSAGEWGENGCAFRGENTFEGGCFITEVVNTNDCGNVKAGSCRNSVQCNDERGIFGGFSAACAGEKEPGCGPARSVMAAIESLAHSRHASYVGRVTSAVQGVLAPLSDEQKEEILSHITGIQMYSHEPGKQCFETYLEGAIDWSAGTAAASSSAEGTEGDEQGSSEPGPEPAEEARYMIEVAVSADGFEPATVFAPCNYEPSSVTIQGEIVDDSGRPVAGAMVSLVGLGARIVTDETGRYSLTVPTDGDTPFSALRNVMIVRLVENLQATVTPISTVWANGREYEALLTVTAGGLPLATKEITLTDWKGFSHQGRTIDYVAVRHGNNIPLRLDDGGQARFRFEAPIVPRDKRAAIANPGSAFPVEGHFRVMLRGQSAETECAYRVASPFPKIGRIRVPGNVDAGLWQVSPSSIVIEDPDSNSFQVTVRGLGDFRTTQPGAATKNGMLSHELDGKHFEFLYRPRKEGLDPTAMPDVLDQFMNTSKNIYIGMATSVGGGMLLEKVQIRFGSGALDKGLSKIGLELDAGDLLAAGGNMANVSNLASGAYLDVTTMAEDPNNIQKHLIAGGNIVIGAVDTGMGIAGTLTTAQQALAWETAKAYWEYLKLINSVSDQYHELAEAYQGTIFHPILVTVEDESGHRTTASRACSVRVWKGGSQ